MKKLLFTIVTMIMPMLASAFYEDTEKVYEIIDGIPYNLYLNTQTAEVTSNSLGLLYDSKLEIPERVVYFGREYVVTSIGRNAFTGHHELIEVSVPATVTTIGEEAFDACTNLISISLPNSLTTIEDRAFYQCFSLISLTMPNSVSNLGIEAFSYCRSLTSITLSTSLTRIDDRVFERCSALESIIIPNSVTSIGVSSFLECKNLSSVTIPSSVTRIESGAFGVCENINSVYISDLSAWLNIDFDFASNPLNFSKHLYVNGEEITDLVIPNSVSSIKRLSFDSFSGLKSVTIGKSVTSIGEWAFFECYNLKSLDLGNSVKSIGKYAFDRCVGLKNVEMPNSLEIIEDCAFAETGLTIVTIGNSVTTIGSAAFYLCRDLTSVKIPSSVTIIEESAFIFCENLTSVIIGSGVKEIKDRAFACSEKLSDVYCLSEIVPSTSLLTFEDSHIENATLYVPGKSLNDYKSAEPWKNFKEIIPIDDTSIKDVNSEDFLIRSNDNVLTITEAPVGSVISVYNLSGQMVGSAKAGSETTNISTSLHNGEIGIVKIGEKSVKVLIK